MQKVQKRPRNFSFQAVSNWQKSGAEKKELIKKFVVVVRCGNSVFQRFQGQCHSRLVLLANKTKASACNIGNLRV